jgi:hypothetical protein
MNGSENPPPSRGGKRMLELAQKAEAERVQLEGDILREVGGEPSTLHKIAAEALSSAIVGARRKRSSGKYDSEELNLVARLLRATGLRPPPGTGPTAPTLRDYIDAINNRDDAE